MPPQDPAGRAGGARLETEPGGPAATSARAALPRPDPVDLLVLGGLLLIAVLLRVPELGPSSLWLDDAWVALTARADSLGEHLLVSVTAPLYVLVLAGFLGLVGFSELNAQLPAFVAGVAVPAVGYAVAVRAGIGRAGALLGAGLLATSPVLVEYSTRVKHFTLDALIVVVLLAIGAALLRRPLEPRRWWLAAGVGLVTTVASAGTAPVAGGVLAAGAAAAWAEGPVARRDGRTWRRDVGTVLAAGGLYAVSAALWGFGVVRQHTAPDSLHDYWADHFLVTDAGLAAFGADLLTTVGRLLGGFAPIHPTLTGVGLIAALALVMRRRGFAPTVLTTLPLLTAVALAALALAPLGTGRTDSYLHPVLALILAMGLDEATRARSPGGATGTQRAGDEARAPRDRLRGSVAPLVALALVVATAITAALRAGPDYPEQDVRPLVAVLEQQVVDDDAIVIYPATRWAFALYTPAPIDLVPYPQEPNGFRPRFHDPRIAVLETHHDEPDRYRAAVANAVGEHDRAWLLASHIRDDLGAIRAAFEAAGFSREAHEERPGAQLDLWVRQLDG
jgi:hypothetical protein